MSSDICDDMRLLIQAGVDGELSSAEAARVQAHLETCPACTAMQQSLLDLSRRIRNEAEYARAPEALVASVRARIARSVALPAVARPSRRPLRWAAPFGGAALAASLALVVLLANRGDHLTDDLVTSHVRALQPGHLMDVISTDQHTVKPWFDGRVTFAPPVKDLKAQGFPLTGGRLDYVDGRTVAVMVYQHGKHVIDLFAWPGHGVGAMGDRQRDGYIVAQWEADGMVFCAVSDIGAGDLDEFERNWKDG